MQTTHLIPADRLDELLAAVFAAGDPIVSEAYSDYDTAVKIFPTLDSLRGDVFAAAGQKRKHFHYALHYPEAGGYVVEQRIELKPGEVQGHTHRFAMEGWGLIYLQLTLKDPGRVECCILADSAAQAGKRADTMEHLGTPDLWDWQVVEHHAERLTKLVRELAEPSP